MLFSLIFFSIVSQAEPAVDSVAPVDAPATAAVSKRAEPFAEELDKIYEDIKRNFRELWRSPRDIPVMAPGSEEARHGDGGQPMAIRNQVLRPHAIWYVSTTELFHYCVQAKFRSPLCPLISASAILEPQIYSAPKGALTPQSLFDAKVYYEIGRSPETWLRSLNLDNPLPAGMDPRLYAEARWLYAKTLFDRRKYKESAEYFDLLVEDMKGRPIFHQQRAWVQFFTGNLDRALGSIVSAESPLLKYKVPFFEKYFIRGLVERESCQWKEAYNTVIKGRNVLQIAKAKPEKHPWVILCQRENHGKTCDQLEKYFSDRHRASVQKSLNDLDILEIELRERGAAKPGEKSTSEIVWAFIGEGWRDELGYYSVPLSNQCKA